MEQIDAHWTQTVNLLTIRCDCGKEFIHRVDRWTMICPACGKRESIEKVR